MDKGKHEEEGEIGKERDEQARDGVVTRQPITKVKDYGVGGGEEQRMRAKIHGRIGIAKETTEERGTEA